MKKLILIVFIGIGFTAQAQPEFVDRIGFKLESIADIDIGWMKIYKPTTPAKGKQLGNRIYSARQIGYCQQFIEWMQQSYLPKGCLGDAGYYLNEIPKFSGTNSKLGNEINQHGHALPHMYGASSRMYTALKKDAQGKFAPLYNFAEYWRIEANQLQYISSPVELHFNGCANLSFEFQWALFQFQLVKPFFRTKLYGTADIGIVFRPVEIVDPCVFNKFQIQLACHLAAIIIEYDQFQIHGVVIITGYIIKFSKLAWFFFLLIQRTIGKFQGRTQ